jgi:pyridoxamine 5'-phosphate oxidase
MVNQEKMKIKTQEIRKEYGIRTLDEKKAPGNPIHLFSDWFEDAVRSGIDEPNAMVLATAGPNGDVTARVVLLKSAGQAGFTFFTNYNSVKARQIQKNPRGALVFFWKEMERQVRVEGKMKKVSRRESIEYFDSRPLDSRISASVSPQSEPVPDRAFLESRREGFVLDLGMKEPVCPPDWGGFILIPDCIEFWQGREYRLHDRLQYTKTGKSWVLERLAP